ncbi:LemA family protein [Luteolibacter pohnpeiensis]|uniref:LemA family protein n=1 Tax=Luteolibacter pohnpeiensis TaxID=454153 RepID=A0A934S319_9BACT|nr:LemA family protein [Luteolibacter pohnpeiensis]MBK1881417.1 LemA family protein [Luteolibacter pohnpeiensis]
MEIIWLLLAVIVVFLLWLAITYNSLVNRRNQVRYAFATIDVQLKKRFDLVPNLVETVKGYAAHEREVLEAVTKARQQALSHRSSWHDQEMLHQEVGRLVATAEAYPDLKSDRQFLMLQRQLAECEAQIAAARRTYNASVMDYNNSVGMVPSSIVASMFNFKTMPQFEIAVNERTNPNVRF